MSPRRAYASGARSLAEQVPKAAQHDELPANGLDRRRVDWMRFKYPYKSILSIVAG